MKDSSFKLVRVLPLLSSDYLLTCATACAIRAIPLLCSLYLVAAKTHAWSAPSAVPKSAIAADV